MSDRIIKGLAYDGRVSIIAMESTEICEEARKVHSLSPVCTAAFGRLLTVTALIGCQMKSDDNKLTIQIKGNGPIGTMLTVANPIPVVKGYVINPAVDLPLNEFGKLDVSSAVGNEGFIHVIKDIGLKDPYVGISPIVSGEIADDFANYFLDSEQTNSAVALGVLVDKDGVRKAGGYIINPMPDVREEDLTALEKAIFEAGSVSKMLENNLDIEELARKVTGDKKLKIVERNDSAKYECDCNKGRMEKALVALGKEELQKMIEEDGGLEMSCHFCNKKYQFSKEELLKLI
ncbi:MAG: Hsp33 family molecular chaperone HslO [Clostridia bacterium]|nr:Hsp33 family molecular chaperone HslO [Clostridia bacterium]